MKCHQTLILSLISSVISTTTFTNTFNTQLNDIDAAQQHQQAKDDKLQPKPDIRLNISPTESRLLNRLAILSINGHLITAIFIQVKVKPISLHCLI
ncbi:hypothetical protein JFL60_03610 [Histophilus somni]|uniref:hypothetical protein n=1 Tax=Histophilus somni TaxID=731 RepID=UPI0018EE1A8E|nr:hypothetical protein [Histophilus somni]QQF66354.1 hypothetical protein JFL60_03610 [Histophilus somni]